MIGALAAVASAAAAGADATWCGLAVEPERKRGIGDCLEYDADKYRYPPDLDRRYVEARGVEVDDKGRLDRPFPSPYVHGIRFRYLQDMDIEHVVPRSEAHDSGLCERPDEWTPFASDMLNIVVASEHVNRTLKSDREPHEWLPDKGRRKYARTWVEVKRKYRLSVDAAERDALERILGGRCPE